MDGIFELHAFLSVLLLLAIAFVALVCDYLKGANETLREENVELRTRIQEPVKKTARLRTAPILKPIQTASGNATPWYVDPPAPPDWAKQEGMIPIRSEEVATVAIDPPKAEVTMQGRPRLRLPAGYYPRFSFRELASSTDLFTGVVVSIGANDADRISKQVGAEKVSDALRRMEAMLVALIGAKDFGCRAGEHEFVLVYPDVTGPKAQQKLAKVSEKLWDFQLRSGETNLTFSWGAVEVRDEAFAESTASACERMYQSQRARKAIPMDRARKSVVNL
jgi:GGDEF domain-containing protein